MKIKLYVYIKPVDFTFQFLRTCARKTRQPLVDILGDYIWALWAKPKLSKKHISKSPPDGSGNEKKSL